MGSGAERVRGQILLHNWQSTLPEISHKSALNMQKVSRTATLEDAGGYALCIPLSSLDPPLVIHANLPTLPTHFTHNPLIQ